MSIACAVPGLVAVVFVGGSHLLLGRGFEGMVGVGAYTSQSLLILLPWAFVGVFRLRFGGSGRTESWRSGWQRTLRRLIDPEFWATRLVPAMFATAVLSLVMATFTGWKLGIPAIRPFAWDSLLAAADRAVHGGVDPWRLLHPALGTPWVTRVIDILYFPLWYPFVVAFFVWQACAPSGPDRTRFLLTYYLSWSLLGVGMAAVFSSGGPVYFARLTGSADPFVPLFDYLEAAGGERRLLARQVQEWLWAVHTGSRREHFAGIAAMPSLHVAISYLTVLAAYQARLRLRGLVLIYFLLVAAGSVHLGSHYAIDGYVSVLLVHLLWTATAPVARTLHRGDSGAREVLRGASRTHIGRRLASSPAPSRGDVMHHGNKPKQGNTIAEGLRIVGKRLWLLRLRDAVRPWHVA